MTAPTKAQMAQNALLSVLSEADRTRLQPHMLAVDMDAHGVLCHAGQDVVDT